MPETVFNWQKERKNKKCEKRFTLMSSQKVIYLLLWVLVGLCLVNSIIEKCIKNEGRWCCYFSDAVISLVSLPISVFQMYTRMNCNFRQTIAWMKNKIRVLLDHDQLWPSQFFCLFLWTCSGSSCHVGILVLVTEVHQLKFFLCICFFNFPFHGMGKRRN